MKRKYYKVSAVDVAAKLKCTPAAVRLWRRTGKIPKNPLLAELYRKACK